MRINGLFRSILSISLVFGAMALTASAQRGRDWNGYPNWGGSFDLRQTALNAGYNDGMKAGQNDAQRGRSASYSNSSDYRNATHDYSSRLGDRSLYQRYYRIAFEHGYADGEVYSGGYNNNGYNGGYNNGGYNNGGYPNGGYNNNHNANWNNRPHWGRNWGQYGNYGGNAAFRQTALNAGYNQGIAQGRKDRSRGERDLNSFSQYRNANKDYNSRDGNLGLYQRYYREGFENGYYDGLRGY